MPNFSFKKYISKQLKDNKILRNILQYTLYSIIRLLFATYRLQIIYKDTSLDNKKIHDHPGIFYFWHQQIIAGMLFFSRNKSKGYCIVSPSNDGKIAGFICAKLGFNVLYGSSSKSPIALIKDSVNVLNTAKQLCLVGDGSRGPAFKLQKGLQYLSTKTGVPLVFIECSVSRAITFTKSWDQFKIPLPFSKITVTVHAPEYASADQ
ncbi:MAG: DUF374 domain-containing protein [bacterium]